MLTRVKNILLNVLLVGLIVFFFSSMPVFAQKNTGKLYRKALKLFNEENFEEALPLFLKLDTLKPDDFYVKYYIGACYLNTKYQKRKAIPYLEFALEKGEKLLPKTVFLDLARLYHLTYKFDRSIDMIYSFLKLADKSEDIDEIKSAHRLLEIDKRAKEMFADSLNYSTEKLPYPINTKDNSEHGAFISADAKTLFFTRTYFYGKTDVLKDSISVIYRSMHNDDGTWSFPEEIKLNGLNEKEVELVGVSYDANYLFLKIGQSNASDLYLTRITGNVGDSLVKLPKVINSNFYEGGISFTPEGDVFYFSSNRPGGYGGRDIYKITRDNKGNWSEPINLGPVVNTKYNEDYPFIHPGGKILYFTSDDPNKTIGGYDIYETEFSDSKHSWSEPRNLGFPINTPDNDIGFVTNAEGNLAYYSSSINDEKGLYDIYTAELETSIPLTMIKGFIYRKDTHQPLAATIKVYDKEHQNVVKYVYNPNPKSGKYIMILPPDHDYVMLVQAKGFKPYLLEIHVPHQSYFYELYQEIFLEPIMLNYDYDTLGERIKVKNLFYDTEKFFKGDTADASVITKAKNYESLLNLVHDIVSLSDSLGVEYVNNLYSSNGDENSKNVDYKKEKKYNRLLNLINKAISTTDTAILQKIDENTAFREEREEVTYYSGSKNDSLILKKVIVCGDTLYVAKVVKTERKFKNMNMYHVIDDSDLYYNSKKYKYFVSKQQIYYKTGQYKIPGRYVPLLNDLVKVLNSDENLFIELHGYADEVGKAEYNKNLSYKRVVEISRFFKEHGITGKRVKLFAHGEIHGKRNAENRRVEIKIFEKE